MLVQTDEMTTYSARKMPKIALLWLALLFASQSHANNLKVFVIIPEASALTEAYIENFRAVYTYSFTTLKLTELTEPPCDNENCLYIAIGPKTLNILLNWLDAAPIISVLTSSIAFQKILATHPESQKKFKQTSAIYAEPSLQHQLDLIKSVYPQQATIGLLYSEESKESFNTVRKTLNETSLSLLSYKIESPESIAKALNAISTADVLLAIPDNVIYNTKTFRYIILTCYRRKQAIIGFSENFVKSGALGTSYYTIDHMAKETAVAIFYYHLHKNLPEPYHAKNFGIVFNNAVANSLNITVRENDLATDDIRFLDGAQYVESDRLDTSKN